MVPVRGNPTLKQIAAEHVGRDENSATAARNASNKKAVEEGIYLLIEPKECPLAAGQNIFKTAAA